MAVSLHGRMWERKRDWLIGYAMGSFFVATSISQVYWGDGRPVAVWGCRKRGDPSGAGGCGANPSNNGRGYHINRGRLAIDLEWPTVFDRRSTC